MMKHLALYILAPKSPTVTTYLLKGHPLGETITAPNWITQGIAEGGGNTAMPHPEFKPRHVAR